MGVGAPCANPAAPGHACAGVGAPFKVAKPPSLPAALRALGMGVGAPWANPAAPGQLWCGVGDALRVGNPPSPLGIGVGAPCAKPAAPGQLASGVVTPPPKPPAPPEPPTGTAAPSASGFEAPVGSSGGNPTKLTRRPRPERALPCALPCAGVSPPLESRILPNLNGGMALWIAVRTRSEGGPLPLGVCTGMTNGGTTGRLGWPSEDPSSGRLRGVSGISERKSAARLQRWIAPGDCCECGMLEPRAPGVVCEGVDSSSAKSSIVRCESACEAGERGLPCSACDAAIRSNSTILSACS